MSACEYCYNDPCDCTIDAAALAAALTRSVAAAAEPLKVGALFAGHEPSEWHR